MGTRNLVEVKLDGELKVSQYGQWDGYPTGQGATIQEFLRDVDIEVFKEKLRNLKQIDEKKVEEFLEKIGCKDGWMDSNQSNLFREEFPGINRDLGAGILQLIYDGEIVEVRLSPDFKDDKLFCEYHYLIDLDKGTVKMNNKRARKFEDWCEEGLMEKLEK